MKILSFFALFLIILIGLSLTSCNFNVSNGTVPSSVNEASFLLKWLIGNYKKIVDLEIIIS